MMTQAPKPPVNLDVIADEYAGSVVLFGETHQVRQIDGVGYDFAIGLQQGTVDVREGYALLAELIPSLSPEQVKKVTGVQLNAVLLIADCQVQAVEALYPKAVGPTAAPSAPPPASSPRRRRRT